MDYEALLKSISESLASKALSEEQLSTLAKKVGGSKYPVVGVDVCTYGICLDFAVDDHAENLNLKDILDVGIGPVKNIEIFPEGIILPDRLNVRLVQKM